MKEDLLLSHSQTSLGRVTRRGVTDFIFYPIKVICVWPWLPFHVPLRQLLWSMYLRSLYRTDHDLDPFNYRSFEFLHNNCFTHPPNTGLRKETIVCFSLSLPDRPINGSDRWPSVSHRCLKRGKCRCCSTTSIPANWRNTWLSWNTNPFARSWSVRATAGTVAKQSCFNETVTLAVIIFVGR